MAERYEPSSREVLAEISDLVTDFVSRRSDSLRGNLLCAGESLKYAGESLKELGVLGALAGGAAVRSLLYPYVLPTIVRKLISDDRKARQARCYPASLDPDENIATSIRIIGGMTLNFGQLLGYSYLATHDHPEALAIPVATNVLSGMYEFGKSTYEHARDRVVDRAEKRRWRESRRMMEGSIGSDSLSKHFD